MLVLASPIIDLEISRKPKEYHEGHLKMSKEVRDRAGEGEAYGNLGIAYDRLGDFQKATEYHKRHVKISKEVGDIPVDQST